MRPREGVPPATPHTSDPVEHAEDRAAALAALDLVQSDPSDAARRAATLLDVHDVPTHIVARWALGRARYELGDLPAARRELVAAERSARRHGLTEHLASIRLSLAVVLAEQGHSAAALRVLDDVLAGSHDEFVVGRALNQRAFVLYHLGRPHDALVDANRALPLMRKVSDDLGIARLLVNRGMIYISLDDSTRALADFEACDVVAERLGQRFIVAAARHNTGFVLGRMGRITEALDAYEQARAAYRELDDPGRAIPVLDADISETLLSVGLAQDAIEHAVSSLDGAARSGNVLQEAEARLRLARALLASDRWAEAAAESDTAARVARRAGRRTWTALARYVSLEAALSGGLGSESPRRRLDRAERLIDVLAEEGWAHEATGLRISAARLAARVGETKRAIRLLDQEQRRGRSPLERMHAELARAMAFELGGDGRAAADAARRGLGQLDRYRASIGSTELRVSASSMASQLVTIGLRRAVAAGHAADVVSWSERLRATSAFQRAVPGGAAPGDGDVHAERAARELARRSLPAAGQPRASGSVMADGRDLVSYAECDGSLYAAVRSRGHWRLCDTGSAAVAAEEIAYLRSAVRRSMSSPTAAQRHRGSVERAAARVESMLLSPLGVGAAPVAIVPCGAVSGLPWGLLPSLRDIDHTVNPSVASWRASMARHTAPPAGRRVVAVGPDLPGGLAEATVLAARFGDRLLLGADASVTAVLAAFTSCDMLHLAAHGQFRRDSPLFSSFGLADGELSLLAIEQLQLSPSVVVLPSCEAGVSSRHPGDDVIGVVATLLGRGARSVIAPLDVVPDDALVAPMIELHEGLEAGLATDAALATVRRNTDLGSVAGIGVSVFSCFGGAVRVLSGPRSA